MTQEALRMALEALEKNTKHLPVHFDCHFEAITAIKEALAQPEQDSTYTYASSLATAIWQKHYMKESPKWKPLDTTEGVLTQIDNMTCGLIKEKPAQPEQEPVMWSDYESNGIHHKPVAWMDSDGNVSDNNDHNCFPIPLYTTPPQRTEQNFCSRCGKRTADLTVIHTCTPPQENT